MRPNGRSFSSLQKIDHSDLQHTQGSPVSRRPMRSLFVVSYNGGSHINGVAWAPEQPDTR